MSTGTPADDPSLRQRKPADSISALAEKRTTAAIKKEDVSRFSVVDVLRAIVGLLLMGGIAGYLVTGSYTWGLQERRPWWLQSKGLQSAWNGALLLTPTQLSQYDGSSPDTPIYLALNRTIYDVSSSPQVYGPGGTYHSLTAKDATRAYITGCFDPPSQLSPYLSGAEEIHVPLWLSRDPAQEELDALVAGGVEVGGKSGQQLVDEVRARVGKKRVERMREEAYAKGREKVAAQVETWRNMFERKGYPVVGKVVGVDEKRDEKVWKNLGFCEQARKQRPGMAETLGEALKEVMGGAMGREGVAAGKVGSAGKVGAAGGQMGDAKARDAFKEEVRKEKVLEQKRKEAVEGNKPAGHP